MRDLVKENSPSSVGGPFKAGALAWAKAISYQPFMGEEGDSERERLERSVVEDVSYLASHPLVKPSIKLTGYVYDLHTGRVEEVDCGLPDPTHNTTDNSVRKVSNGDFNRHI